MVLHADHHGFPKRRPWFTTPTAVKIYAYGRRHGHARFFPYYRRKINKQSMRKTRETRLAPLLERTLKALKGQLSPRTLENYRSSISKVKRFEGDRWERLGVGDIDRRWSDRYALWLAKRHEKPQTADCYLRNFRAVYRHALALRADSEGGKPFEGYRSRSSRPAKRALPKEEARRLLSPGLRERLSERLLEVLDILLFILYARGMAFNDVYELRWQMVADGHIRYRRSKTGVFIDVLVVPELERIMRRYRRKGSPYVFPFLHAAQGVSRGGAVGAVGAAPRQPGGPRDRAAGRAVASAHHLRAAPHLGDAHAGGRPARRADQPGPWPHLHPHHADLPRPHQRPEGRRRRQRHV